VISSSLAKEVEMKTDNESNQPKRIFLSDYKAPSFRVKNIDLHFNLHESATLVRAIQQIEKTEDAELVLNGEGLILKSIALDGKTLTSDQYVVTDETLTVKTVPAAFTLETLVEINPEANKSCEGLYLSKGIFATQCEAEGFRHITYFLDRPDVMTSYTVTVEADKKKYPVLLSNGDLISKKDLDNGRHQAVWKDPHKKPSYLFALVAGDLGVVSGDFTTMSGKKVKLEVYASHGKQSRCHHALESLRKSMKWDEERFGLEYDLNQYMIVSIDDFNMGAMENKGLNIFNSRLVLADPQSATDTDFERIESVVGHEYFHNWTGNRVTCRNWFELSLKEGLTVFRDQEFSSDLNSRAVQRIKDVDSLRSGQFGEDAGPNAHPVRPESCLSVDNFYTSTIYEKGAEVIRMMQTIVGRKGFRKGMDEYFKRHDGQAVTILDFADAIATPNNADFSQFKLWYSQAGTPEVSVTESYDATKKQFSLTLKQFCKPTEKQPVKKPFHIPLLVGLLNSKGEDILIRSNDVVFNSDEQPVIHLKQETQTFVFNEVDEKPVLSLNREFSAPIKLNWNASQAEILHLIKYDSDAFNRREAVFKMTLNELRRLVASQRTGQTLIVNPEIISALGTVLNDTKIDPQFKALMLQLPSSENLAQEEDVLDAVAFSAARNALVSAFVEQQEASIKKLYFQHHAVSSIGDRALKNRLLRYLVEAEVQDSVKMASTQYTQAQNMTDTIAALSCLCETSSQDKENALADFLKKWKDDAVVFNKYLLVQAIIEKENTFEVVEKLSQTAPFSFENPNNIYSLLGAFGENFLGTQRKDGKAYKWLCDQIIKIDKNNPQVAARVCGSFNYVQKFPEPFKSQALTEIKRVLAEPKLSNNSRELLETLI
jgi:aminopeptidase N